MRRKNEEKGDVALVIVSYLDPATRRHVSLRYESSCER